MIVNPKNVLEEKNISGLLDYKRQLQIVSIDLTLAEVQKPLTAAIISEEKRELPIFEKIFPQADNFFHLPQGCYTVAFNEAIEMPANTAAFIIQRSSLNRALATITASVIDPGYKTANLSASLYVFNQNGILIEKNCRVAAIYFVKSDATRLYNGFYQNEGKEKEEAKSLEIEGKDIQINKLKTQKGKHLKLSIYEFNNALHNDF